MSEQVILTCPHGQELYAWEKNGVYHYQHRDKTSGQIENCTVNNSFKTPVEMVLATLGKSEGIADLDKPNTPAMRAAFVCSLPLRIAFYKKMASITERDGETGRKLLEGLTQRLIWCFKGAHNDAVLIWELDKIFGPVIWKNLALYMDESPVIQMAQHTEQISAHLLEAGKYRLPELELLNLQNARENAAFFKVTNQLNQAEEYYNQFKTGSWKKRGTVPKRLSLNK